MAEQRVLMVGGTVNQMKMMHQIAKELDNARTFFSPFYYVDNPLFAGLERLGLLRYTLGKEIQRDVLRYCEAFGLPIDFQGQHAPYDLVVLGTDIFIPKNLRSTPKILVQEGILLPCGWRYWLARHTILPNWVGAGHAAGLSGAYEYFCVASQGYFEWLVETGLDPDRLVVTGLPNFDDLQAQAAGCPLPYRNYVLVAMTPSREDLRYEDGKGLLLKAREVAGGRTIIVKLHPRQNVARASRQVRQTVPEAVIVEDGDIAPLIAHCDHFLTTTSSTIFNALACDKPIHCDLDLDFARRLLPEQNGGRAAANIAAVCRRLFSQQVQAVPGERQRSGEQAAARERAPHR